MKLTWNGHSCFSLECQDGTIVFDPYQKNSVPGLKPLNLKADLILCSHEHEDHHALNVVTLSGTKTDFTIDKIETFHDDQNGALRGKNIIHIVQSEGMQIVHLGDLGCDLTSEQTKKIFRCDVLMIPIGGHYTIDALEAYLLVQKIQPRIVIPMHYRSKKFGYKVIGTLPAFTDLCHDVIQYETNYLEITKDTPSQTAVLTY